MKSGCHRGHNWGILTSIRNVPPNEAQRQTGRDRKAKRQNLQNGRWRQLLFPGDHDATKIMSENTVNSALRAMGYDTKTEVCGHGFRTMARGAMGESGLWNDDAIERQLSHSERNNVRAAYIHTSEHLDERRLMVQWWADYLDVNRQGYDVTPYDFAKKL